MSREPALFAAAVTAVGAAATIALAALSMPGDEVGHLALSLLPALLLSVAASAIAAKLLAGASIRRRTLGAVALASVVGLLNLIVLGALMYLDDTGVGKLAVLLAYSTAAGVGAALALTRSTTTAIDDLTAAARRMGGGDLEARSGPPADAPELAELARALDDMAVRLQASIERERDLESHRLDMITAASHDLRTPLASLRAMIEALEDGLVAEAERGRYLGEMGSSVKSLTALTDDLFDLLKVEAGELEADDERLPLRQVAAAALALCDGQARAKQIRIDTAFGPAEDAMCSPRVGRVIQNLVQNAIRHTPAGGCVAVEAGRRQAELVIVVSDNGEGISAESLEKVFEPFWRGEQARTSKGSGLGLTLVKRIVERLGGEIMVSSTPMQGARFAVSLPAG